MSMPKRGDIVRQITQAPIIGEVVMYAICQETGDALLKVEWPDENGDGIMESRYFKVGEVETIFPVRKTC